MTDDPTKRGPQDRSRIDIDEPYEVEYWSRELGVTPEKLTAIVRSVGPGVTTVRKNIESGSASATDEPLTPSGDQRIAAEE